MKLRVHLSGSTIFSIKADLVPPIGSVVRVRTTSYKKGLRAGSLVEVTVTADQPPVIDYEDGSIYINANGYSVIEEGPDID